MNDDQKRAFDLIVSLRNYYGDYHHKKEQAAYAVAFLYLGAIAAVITKPEWRACHDQRFFFSLWVLASVFALLFVAWQLFNRRSAAMLVSATTTVASDWIHRAPAATEYAPVTCGRERWPQALVTELRGLRCAFWLPVLLTLAPLLLGAVAVGYLIFPSC